MPPSRRAPTCSASSSSSAARAARRTCSTSRTPRSPSQSSSARHGRDGCGSRAALSRRRRQRARPRGRVAARGRGRSAGCSTSRGSRRTRRTGAPPPPRVGASCSRAGSVRTTCATRSRPCGHGPSTRRRRSSASPASRITTKVRAYVEAARRVTDVFGDYGGRYVPETLIPALDELERGVARGARRRRVPRGAAPPRDDVRRPADAAHARRALRARQAHLSEARGPPAHRRTQDQQRARAGGARAAARQEAHRRRDRRGPARRRDGDRVRALRLRVRRLHGRGRHAAAEAERRAHGPARRRGAPRRLRHEDAEGGDERGDPRLDHERRDDALPDRLVRRPGAVSGARRASCSR